VGDTATKMRVTGVFLLMSVCVSVLLGGSTDTRGLQYGDWKPIIPSRRHFSNRAGQNLDYIDELYGPIVPPQTRPKQFVAKKRRGKKIYTAKRKRNPDKLAPKPPISNFDYLDFPNWEPMSLKEYEETQRKVKRNNKPNKLPITVPSLHLNPPQFPHQFIPKDESLTSLKPIKETSAIKRQVVPPRPPNPPKDKSSNNKKSNEAKKSKKKTHKEKIPITVPSLHLKPPGSEKDKKATEEPKFRYKKETTATSPAESTSIRASEGILIHPKTFSTPPKPSLKSEEDILKTPISLPISRQGAFVGNFPPAKRKQNNPFKKTGAKPPLPPQPFGPPPTSAFRNPTLKPSSNFVPTIKPSKSFPFKKAVPDEKVATKAPFPKNVFKKHKRKTTNKILPIPELLFAPADLAQEFAAVKKRKASEQNKQFFVKPTIENDKPKDFVNQLDPEDQRETNRPIRTLATYASLPSYSSTVKEENEEKNVPNYTPKKTNNVVKQTNVKYAPKPKKQSYSPKPIIKAPNVQSRIVNSPPAKDVAEDRQGSGGPQIPIISQTQEMNQDSSQSFAFDFVTGNGITRSETGSLQPSGQQQRGQWEYTAPNGEIIKTSFISDGLGGYRPEGNKIFIPVFGPP